MLLLLLLHLLITSICTLAGLIFYAMILRNGAETEKPLIFYPITGLIIITLVSQIAVLFMPVNFYFTIGFLVILLFLAFIQRNRVASFYRHLKRCVKNQSGLQLLLVIAIWITIIILNAGPTMMDDTESYHIQMIKWSNEYGTVPGIVNLHFRFGFNSSWFTSISFFLPPHQSFNFFTTLNGIISAWFCIFLVFQLDPGQRQKNRYSVPVIQIGILLVLLLSFFCWPMIRGNGSTANYDFITTAIVLILFIKILQAGKPGSGDRFITELIMWPVYLFTVRIINYPLLLLTVYGFYLLLRNKEWSRMILFLTVSALLMIPFLARNLILSGYPFYPSTAFHLLNVDWKPDDEMIVWLKNYIKYYNRVNEGLLSIEETQKLGFPQWIFAWFRYMAYYDKAVVMAGLSGLLLNLMLLKRAFSLYSNMVLFFMFVLAAQLISWFFIAPDSRFVYGCLLCGALTLPVILLRNRNIVISGRLSIFVFIVLIAGVMVYAVMKTGRNKAYQNFAVPVSLPQPPVKEVVVDGITMYIPERILNNWNPRCYGTELPCLYILDPKLRARGKSITDGFRLVK